MYISNYLYNVLFNNNRGLNFNRQSNVSLFELLTFQTSLFNNINILRSIKRSNKYVSMNDE